MEEIFGHQGDLGWVALKAGLLFLTAVIGFRLTGRRTLAQLTGFDFVAAVAVGAVVGRVPNSTSTSFLQGAMTLIAVFAVHALVTRLRSAPPVLAVVQHAPRVVVLGGEVDDTGLHRAGMTEDDLAALLRGKGVRSVREVRCAIVEAAGSLSVLLESSPTPPEPSTDADDRLDDRLWAQ